MNKPRFAQTKRAMCYRNCSPGFHITRKTKKQKQNKKKNQNKKQKKKKQKLHGRLEIRNFSSRVEKYFTRRRDISYLQATM